MKKHKNKMRAILVAAAISLTAVEQTIPYNTKAEEKIYDDNDISLSTAFDKYIASGTGELAKQLQIVVQEEIEYNNSFVMEGNNGEISSGNITEVTDAEPMDVAPEATIGESDANGSIQESAEGPQRGTLEAIKKPTTTNKKPTTTTTTATTTQNNGNSGSLDADYSKFAGKAVVTTAGTVNIRKSATASSDKVGTIRTGGVVTVEEKGSEWSLISSGGVQGYIKNEFLAFDNAAGKYAAEHSGSISYDSAKAYTAPAPSQSASNEDASEESSGGNVITTATGGYQPVCDFAMQYKGNPYKYGGSSLTEGTDCSGFTMSCYREFGYNLPHSSAMQANCGQEVSLDAVSPGDLVFYKNGGSTIGHVALYIGGGQVIHASTSTTGIIVSNMYYSTPCKAVRIVN